MFTHRTITKDDDDAAAEEGEVKVEEEEEEKGQPHTTGDEQISME